MTDIIQLLPDSVANQIAAGEVIQRPASVIKELVENAIDAGAKNIQVLVSDAGKSSIQVIDDGCGMSDTDARLSFERHATSKIRRADDLFSLHTMGFRGEALASIAAVAQVTLQTRRPDDELGTRLVVCGSRYVEQEPVSCPIGSNFIIENLFFNVPARRKFLKSNVTEMTNITQAFERIVLVYPEVSFSLYNNGQEMLNLRATNMHQRIVDVFGKRINQELLRVETQTSLCGISGFVGKPESAKKKGAHQYFFVNGRFMRHPYFHKAVLSAYERLVPNGEQVSYFLYFTVNPEDIDVNIHPVKTEIKFENEQAIWQILMASVRDAIGRFSAVPEIDFDTEGKPDIPVFNSGTPITSVPHIEVDPTYNPFKKTSAPAYTQKSAKGWEELFDEAKNFKDAIQKPAEEQSLFDSKINEDKEPQAAEYFQYRGQFIISQVKEGLMIVDQSRAHMRILYEQYMKIQKERPANTQKSLFPEVVQFPPSYSAVIDPILEELRILGFDITDLGGCNYAVSGMPAGMEGMDAVSLVSELVTEAMEQGNDTSSQVHSILALGLARKAATPCGVILTNEEMSNLMKQLMSCEIQRYTPDGQTIMTIIDDGDIERRFT
jgi:DNA mismatch repair protein MutL